MDVARQFDPDMVVLDLGLPGLDGVEVCRQIRTFQNAYVVMLTARSGEVDKAHQSVRQGRTTSQQAVQPA